MKFTDKLAKFMEGGDNVIKNRDSPPTPWMAMIVSFLFGFMFAIACFLKG